MVHRLTDILKDKFGLDQEHLSDAERVRTETGGSIGQILVDQKNLSEGHLLEALSIQYDIPFWSKLPFENTESDFTEKVPIQFLKKYNLVPLEYSQPIAAKDCGLTPPHPPQTDNTQFPAG